MLELLHQLTDFVVSSVGEWGYIGIFVMMTLESSFIPFPSEVAMIPAGYLASQGKMNAFAAILVGSAGSLFGALINYYLSLIFGRAIIKKYGKFVGLTDEKLSKFEEFFKAHGEIGIFIARLIPGIRQYISIPAGFARMNLAKFCFYTTLGATIWVSVLVYLGYIFGENTELIKEHLHIILLGTFVFCALLLYWYIKKRKNEKNNF